MKEKVKILVPADKVESLKKFSKSAVIVDPDNPYHITVWGGLPTGDSYEEWWQMLKNAMRR